MPDTLIRPMRAADVEEAERISDEGFFELDQRVLPRDFPDPTARSDAHRRRWVDRTRHLLATDPGGCWVAEHDGTMVGFATSYTRELMWLLATYAVRPGLQGRGVGAQLLAAALQHGRGCLRGMLAASADPKAARRYRLAGFSLHPQMLLAGELDRSAIPVLDRVREGSAADVDLMNSVDRRTRGAAHGADHEVLMRHHPLLVVDRPGSSGYAYVSGNGGPALLGATDRRTATELLWACLANATPGTPVTINHVTAANEWAVDVGMAGRLALYQQGYLALRGMKPPRNYVHNGALL